MRSLADRIDALARQRPQAAAFHADAETLTWLDYARDSDRWAARFVHAGLEPGDRVGVLLPDGPGPHVVYVGAEKAGLLLDPGARYAGRVVLVDLGLGPHLGDPVVTAE